MTRLTRTSLLASVALSATLFAACGGGGGGTPDAGLGPDGSTIDGGTPDSAQPDATVDANMGPDAFVPPGMASCAELATPVATLTTFPATYEGDLAGSEANLDITNAITCAVEDNPTGHLAAGQDEVVLLTGLTPGTKYFVKLRSAEDLAAYVITACDPAMPGPGANDCLAFIDAHLANSLEANTFTAPADGKAFVVVDFWTAEQPPDPTTYTLTVTTEGCLSNDECTTPSAPICRASDANCGSVDYCVGDDTVAEAASDDAPAGATAITLAAVPVVVNAHICFDSNQPDNELDYYKFTVPNGGGVTASMAWADAAADIDMAVVDQAGDALGLSFYQSPESIQLTHLAAGTYFIVVHRATPDSTAVTPYTLTVTRNATSLCTTAADCGTTFQNQLFRASCNAQGACVPLDGAGAVMLGKTCDSPDDCVSAADLCTGTEFMAQPDVRSVCSLGCATDADCTAVGTGYKCSTGMTNECLKACTADNQCPSDVNTPPTAPAPWHYASCTIATGACDIQQ